MNKRATDRPTLTTREAAQALNVSERTIRRMIERGSIEAHKMDPAAKSVYRIPRAEVERLLSTRNAATNPGE